MVDESGISPSTPGYSADTHALINRLRRIEGQVRGLQRMVESEAYCIDVLTQVSAVTSALQNVALSLLDDHLRHCVVDAARLNPEDGNIKLQEATSAIARLVRS
jgi:DNA-binding FrmR family transcriptional regulator